MTKKEFASHDWKVGDILYVIGYKRHKYVKVPICVTRLKVDAVYFDIFHASLLNKRFSKYTPVGEYYRKDGRGQSRDDMFFDRESAYSAFEEKKQEFKRLHKERCRKALKQMLNELDAERNDIYSLFRMKIMKDGL